MHFAKTSAATAFIDGVKSVEAAQAYLLMSVYGLPARRWEEDRSWFYGGLASRWVLIFFALIYVILESFRCYYISYLSPVFIFVHEMLLTLSFTGLQLTSASTVRLRPSPFQSAMSANCSIVCGHG